MSRNYEGKFRKRSNYHIWKGNHSGTWYLDSPGDNPGCGNAYPDWQQAIDALPKPQYKLIEWEGGNDYSIGKVNGRYSYWITREGQWKAYDITSLPEALATKQYCREAQEACEVYELKRHTAYQGLRAAIDLGAGALRSQKDVLGKVARLVSDSQGKESQL